MSFQQFRLLNLSQLLPSFWWWNMQLVFIFWWLNISKSWFVLAFFSIIELAWKFPANLYAFFYSLFCDAVVQVKELVWITRDVMSASKTWNGYTVNRMDAWPQTKKKIMLISIWSHITHRLTGGHLITSRISYRLPCDKTYYMLHTIFGRRS